ncbi:hypothetical protein BJ684DRAFT_21517 [Piptocephalis cylindrospora]|uniref:Uncharacterized protein n=1 Tax=Piptocephalis cylindrospora TaxID=1907219 RepID=A0A4P9XZQ7_9FUNG|nr:hypothetical protein BJ684DRAFT_21517 [Piptocephalis cylindrospora]|eukprot:RKP11907.1 hypothetical protein BJ684DRAFT_21517 [Piptocephalis cylindrospora]
MEYPDGTYMAPTATLDDQLGGLLLPMLGHSLFLAIPLVAFILMRQRPSLRHRCPHVTVIMSLGNALIGAWACLRLAVNPTVVRVPCLVESWLLGLGVPFWFLGPMTTRQFVLVPPRLIILMGLVKFLVLALARDQGAPVIISPKWLD